MLDLSRIGGSDIAALMGLCPYGRGPFDVYTRCVDGVLGAASNTQKKGKLFERSIFDWWLQEYPLESAGYEWSNESVLPMEREWQRATPDAISDVGVCDIKRYRDASLSCGMPGTDEIGDYEMLQLHYYGECLTRLGRPIDELRLVVHDLRIDDLVTYRVDYDPDLGAKCAEAAERFWRDHVKPRRPPPIDGTLGCRRHLESMFPTPSGESRDATAIETAEMIRLKEIADDISKLKREKEEISNRLRASIGEVTKIRCDIGSASWVRVEAREVSYTRAAGRELRTYFRR
jgi:hypothetical protein